MGLQLGGPWLVRMSLHVVFLISRLVVSNLSST